MFGFKKSETISIGHNTDGKPLNESPDQEQWIDVSPSHEPSLTERLGTFLQNIRRGDATGVLDGATHARGKNLFEKESNRQRIGLALVTALAIGAAVYEAHNWLLSDDDTDTTEHVNPPAGNTNAAAANTIAADSATDKKRPCEDGKCYIPGFGRSTHTHASAETQSTTEIPPTAQADTTQNASSRQPHPAPSSTDASVANASAESGASPETASPDSASPTATAEASHQPETHSPAEEKYLAINTKEPSVRDLLTKNLSDGSLHLSKEFIEQLSRAEYFDTNTGKLVAASLERMQPYLTDMMDQFVAENVPPDFVFLAIAESGFRDVRSPAGAVGYFQILPQTAKRYGYTEDDLHDPVISAQIAAKKLAHDYERYTGHPWDAATYGADGWSDGWKLALAAYNGGYVERWFKERGGQPGTHEEFLTWLEKHVNSHTIPNEQKSMHDPQDPEELLGHLKMTIENLTYPSLITGLTNYVLNHSTAPSIQQTLFAALQKLRKKNSPQSAG